MLAITAAEDDPATAAVLRTFLRRYEAERGLRIDLVQHADGAELVAAYAGGVDLILLDVDLPGLDGVSAARRIRDRDHEVGIVFVTRSAAHAVAGYAVDAADYLVKPVAYPVLARVLDRAAARAAARRGRSVVLDGEQGPLRLDAAEVVSLEVAGRRVLVRTLDGSYVVRGPLKHLEAALAPSGFFRCHHGYLVNLGHVVAVRGEAELSTGRSVPVSRPRRAGFLAALTDHLAVAG
jgi:DNA-binding LytR/AlgR family response regulator